MKEFNQSYTRTDNFVDAIEEGKIVRVSEEYAKLEGLPILKKSIKRKKENNFQEEINPSFDDLRKPLNWKKDQVIKELINNFHWVITKKRRELGMTRKQLAEKINEKETKLKLIENGILPSSDFIIINKIQQELNVNLRKDKQDFTKPARSLIKEEESELIQKDIEIIE